MVENIPYSSDPDSFAELRVSAHIWSSHLLCGKFLDLSEGLRNPLWDVLVNVGAVFSAHSLDGGGTAVIATLLFRSCSAGTQFKREPVPHFV